MENRNIFIAGVTGGLVTALFNSIPYLNLINCFCCVGIMTGGAVALFHYDHLSGARQYIGLAQAVTIGISAGLTGSFLSLLLSWLVYLQYGHWEIRLLQTMMEHMEEVPEYFENMLHEIEDQSSGGFQWLSLLFSNLVMFPVFCMAGSILTRLYLNKNPQRL